MGELVLSQTDVARIRAVAIASSKEASRPLLNTIRIQKSPSGIEELKTPLCVVATDSYRLAFMGLENDQVDQVDDDGWNLPVKEFTAFLKPLNTGKLVSPVTLTYNQDKVGDWKNSKPRYSVHGTKFTQRSMLEVGQSGDGVGGTYPDWAQLVPSGWPKKVDQDGKCAVALNPEFIGSVHNARTILKYGVEGMKMFIHDNTRPIMLTVRDFNCLLMPVRVS